MPRVMRRVKHEKVQWGREARLDACIARRSALVVRWRGFGLARVAFLDVGRCWALWVKNGPNKSQRRGFAFDTKTAVPRSPWHDR